jgi:hypothetical protein
MISHKHKFIFIHIPKTAGTTIEKVLQDSSCILLSNTWDRQRVPYAPLNHLTLQEIADSNFISRQQLKSYFKFCFVRNSWDKVVAEIFCRSIAFLFEDLTVEQRIKKACDIAAREIGYGNHIRSQLDFISCRHLQLDFVGRFENLQDDFDYVCGQLGVGRVQLPHLNKSDHKPYWEYYNAETRRLVAETYRQEIEHFGYVFEDNRLHNRACFQPPNRVRPFKPRVK